MAWKNREFGNVIPREFCHLEGNFAILKEILTFWMKKYVRNSSCFWVWMCCYVHFWSSYFVRVYGTYSPYNVKLAMASRWFFSCCAFVPVNPFFLGRGKKLDTCILMHVDINANYKYIELTVANVCGATDRDENQFQVSNLLLKIHIFTRKCNKK